jgi:N-acetylglucosamine kinase-like BadF-type ATPase
MKRYVLGVDIGATKTHALIADETGRARGFGQAGPGNYQGVGYDGMTQALRQATAQALAMAGLSIDQIAGAGLGIGGYDWPSQRAQMIQAIHTAGVCAPLEIVNDAVLGLLAGAAEGWGVALVAGTSNNCRGRDRNGREGRVTGEGTRFGEYGGASELVMKAVHAVAAAWARRGEATRLTEAFVELTGARDTEDLLEGLALERFSLGAEVAPIIFEVARAGDRVAQEVIGWAGRELGDLAVGVIRQLNFEHQSFDVVLLGSLFNGGAALTEPLRATIHAVAPGARLTRLAAPPVVGGVLLAMQQANLDPARSRETLLYTFSEKSHLEHDGTGLRTVTAVGGMVEPA